jgi:dTDP-4-dehydrorhamnose 3,5-epimerase-like enzyme
LKARLLQIESFTDPRGNLIVGEYPKTLPFSPIRFFIVSGATKGESRGNHAHKSTEQTLFCLSGQVTVRVNDGTELKEFILRPGKEGLYIPALHWGEQIYSSEDTSLLVLASEPYSPDEYINTISDFENFIQTLG